MVFPVTREVEEQYELKERKKLVVTTDGNSYAIATENPKVVTLIAEGDDLLVDTKEISDDSPKLFRNGSMVFTLKGKSTTIYAKAVTSQGNLYIVVFA
jgi:hypothetical protein